ncbi:GNAT family N-acetyltransferase [Salininema proteolyticum]|uniref:GNAT family N-acetyltransferase n=1 Tax=Salininema proteolyticum TaxID=1607685 RepID=A0ABV8U3V3_9ACTN
MAVDWLKMRLDLDAFDGSVFDSLGRRCARAGIELTTMAALGDSPESRRSLYELNKACSADIPNRGEFFSFEEYVAQRIETPSYDPEGVVLALDGGAWVGMSAATIRPEGFAFNEMTGVLRPYRGRGLSLTMKVLAVEYAREKGVRWMRTFLHPDNSPVIAMNRRLGYVEEDPESPTA